MILGARPPNVNVITSTEATLPTEAPSAGPGLAVAVPWATAMLQALSRIKPPLSDRAGDVPTSPATPSESSRAVRAERGAREGFVSAAPGRTAAEGRVSRPDGDPEGPHWAR